MTRLVQDERGNALPAWRLGPMHPLRVTAVSQSTPPLKTKNLLAVGILATTDVRVAVGDVANESHSRIPANMWMELVVFPGERVSVVAYDPDREGEIEITELASW